MTHLRSIKALLSILLAIPLLLTSCAAASNGAPSEAAAPGGAGEIAPPAPEEPSAFDQGAQPERIVIQNASLSVVVPDPQQSMDRISALAIEMDGFVVSANLFQSRLESGVEVPQGSITIRVDAARLNEAITRIEAESDRPPLRRDIRSEDVTAEYTDLHSRLRNLQNTEAQLNEILEAADETEEVLSVYNRLSEVRGEIEVTQGRIQYYDQASRLSSIEVELVPDEAVQPLVIGGWEPAGVAKDAIQALVSSARFLGDAAIWVLLYIIPVAALFGLIFILPLYLLVRWIRRRRSNRLAAPPATPAGED